MKPTPSLDLRTRRATDAVVILVSCGFLFLLGLQVVGLVGADEPRYAQVAREMLARHEWVTPYLFGHPWLEKPPLYYWCTMLAYKAAGVSDTAARIPSAVLTSLLVIFIYFWARRIKPEMQLDAALITASAAMMIGFGRSASTDMPLTVMFTVAMLCWYAWHASKGRGWLLAFYFFIGVATVAKGPVAPFLAVVILVLFALLRRERALLTKTLWPIGIALYLAVVSPWYIAVQRENPGFLRSFVLQHNLERFGTNIYHHPQPFWFYLPVALLAFVPWTVFVIAAVADAARDWRFSSQQPPGEEDLRMYLLLWLAVPLVFFSLSQSKLPGYVLPAIPAGTILLADFIRRRVTAGVKPAMWLIVLHGLLSAAMMVAAFVVSFKLVKMALPTGVIIVAATLAIMALLMFIVALRSQGYRVLRFATLIPVVIAFALVLRGLAPIVNLTQSERPVAQTLVQTELGSISEIALYNVTPGVAYGLSFYRNRWIPNYDNGEIPDGDHIVIAPSGSLPGLKQKVPGRTVVEFGGFEWQHLGFYAVAKSTPQQHP